MLTHKGTKEIKTERLTLRRFTLDDANAMYENWAKDERVTEYMTWDPHKSVEETAKMLEYWCESYENESSYNWAIEHKGQLIGNISVARLSERDERVDIGYCIGYDYWNRGFMTEAAKAVINYLFKEINFNRITISHVAENPASGKVAINCGLKYEATRKGYFKYAEGVFLDVIDYSITREEFLKINHV